jgi:hypothetical protein
MHRFQYHHSLSGAVSGAHAYAAYGTWIHNLEGMSYFMIMPEVEMVSEWVSLRAKATSGSLVEENACLY